MKHESVEVTVGGLKVKVITYSVGLERVIVLDRYDNLTNKELRWVVSYLLEEGFLFKKNPILEVVKSV